MLSGRGLKFMVTMYSRFCVALEQARMHNIYKSMNAVFLQKAEENNVEADLGVGFQSKKK